jgi:glycosyltransferase involved in cell wall biosynthesis
LVRSGAEVHVAVPRAFGRTIAMWRNSGAAIHVLNLSLPTSRPGRIPGVLRAARRLIDEVQPDLIHSHFLSTTLALRLALGKQCKIPRIFQVPGPLHLEHWPSRRAELLSAGEADFWIPSSRCTEQCYLQAGVPSSRLFLSYYGWPIQLFSTKRSFYLHERLGINQDYRIVGNINVMYPPKVLLGQTVGLKCHEDVIDALAILTKSATNVKGVLVGNSWGLGEWYERRLRRRAASACGDGVVMPGRFSLDEVTRSWPDFDCAVHIPLSENCGGVIEPLLAGVPVVASAVGGIPEVVIEGITGRLVPTRSPGIVAQTVSEVLSDWAIHQKQALLGRELVKVMFDVNRTAAEIYQIYQHILRGTPRPNLFDSRTCVDRMQRQLSPIPAHFSSAS